VSRSLFRLERGGLPGLGTAPGVRSADQRERGAVQPLFAPYQRGLGGLRGRCAGRSADPEKNRAGDLISAAPHRHYRADKRGAGLER